MFFPLAHGPKFLAGNPRIFERPDRSRWRFSSERFPGPPVFLSPPPRKPISDVGRIRESGPARRIAPGTLTARRRVVVEVSRGSHHDENEGVVRLTVKSLPKFRRREVHAALKEAVHDLDARKAGGGHLRDAQIGGRKQLFRPLEADAADFRGG